MYPLKLRRSWNNLGGTTDNTVTNILFFSCFIVIPAQLWVWRWDEKCPQDSGRPGHVSPPVPLAGGAGHHLLHRPLLWRQPHIPHRGPHRRSLHGGDDPELHGRQCWRARHHRLPSNCCLRLSDHRPSGLRLPSLRLLHTEAV